MTEKKRGIFPLGSLGYMGSVFGVDAKGKHYTKRHIGPSSGKDRKLYNKEYFRIARSKNAPNPPRRNRK